MDLGGGSLHNTIMFKIAIDSGPLSSGHSIRGVGAYTRSLLENLLKIAHPNFEVRPLNISDNLDMDLKDFDLVHLTFFNPFFLSVPFRKSAKKIVVTIHDLIPLIYPGVYSPGIKGRISLAINKILIRKNVDRVVAVSETSKKDISRFLGLSPSKITVIYEAPRKVFRKLDKDGWKTKIRKKYNLPERFVLYVGDLNYNKNIPTLLKACKSADIYLVMVGKQVLDIENRGIDLRTLNGPMDYIRYLFGKPHPELEHYKNLLREFNNNSKIVRLGFVEDEDLVAIYNLATVYCQPSFYEGFGLPVLEAFACGCPVVAARTQALVEVGEAAALFCDPKQPGEFSEAIKKIYKDVALRSQLKNTGLELAKHFNWEIAAKKTLELYRELLQ